MTALLSTYSCIIAGMNRLLDTWFLPTLARFTFVAVLLLYFWNSAKTKLGDGIFGFLHPSDNAYFAIFPKAFEAAGYDSSTLGGFHWIIAVTGTIGEFILPLLLFLGLFTRLAALGMVGFVLVQSCVDITGHGKTGQDLGAWFDGAPGSLIMDQRLLWIVLFAIMITKGAGPFSLDWVLKRFSRSNNSEA